MASAECSEDCNSLVFEAVNESSLSKFQFVRRTYSQIEVLTSLGKCNDIGETPLVIAMKGKNDSLIDELVKFLQNCDHKVAKCHELSLFAIDQLFHHQIPIMELIFHLTKHLSPHKDLRVGWLDFFAQVVFKSTSLSRRDKITALELIGALQLPKYYVCNSRSFAVMFRCWREAMTLRYFPADGEPLLPKILYVGVPSVASSMFFGPAVEVMSIEELNLIEEDFERTAYDRDGRVRQRFHDLLQNQSLLVIRRISNQANHGPSFYIQRLYEFCTRKMIDYGNNIDRSTELKRIVIHTYLLILEQLTGFDPQLLPRQSFDIFMKSLSFASRYLALLAKKPPGYPGREDLSHANLLAVTKFIGTIAKRFPNPATISTIDYDDEGYIDVDALSETIAEMTDSPINEFYHGFADVVYDLVVVLTCIPPQPNNQEKQQTEEHLSDYIINYFAEGKYTPLHVAVHGEITENLEPLKLIIKLGADPNAIDWFGRTPLHNMAGRKEAYLDANLPMFQALVDAGAHLDMGADFCETVLDVVKKNLDTNIVRGVAAQAYFSSLKKFNVFRLSCYCARVIRRHRLPIDGLPLTLQTSI